MGTGIQMKSRVMHADIQEKNILDLSMKKRYEKILKWVFPR